MTWYYERKGTNIYVPNDARSYNSQAKISFKNIQERFKQANYTPDFTVFINRFFRDSRNEILSRQNQIQQRVPIVANAMKLVNWKNGVFGGTPFDRDYIEVKSGIQKGTPQTGSEPVRSDTANKTVTIPDCNRVFRSIEEGMKNPDMVCRLNLSGLYLTAMPKEIYSFRNLQELDVTKNKIPLNEIQQLQKQFPKCKISYEITGGEIIEPTGDLIKIGNISFNARYYPDKEGELLLDRISKVLRTDNKAKIKLRGGYKNEGEKRLLMYTFKTP